MGVYLNPGNRAFQKALNSQIYVDKSELIAYTNEVFDSEQRYICVSRPRRFGKSMAANMLAAYYGKDADSRKQFDGIVFSVKRKMIHKRKRCIWTFSGIC